MIQKVLIFLLVPLSAICAEEQSVHGFRFDHARLSGQLVCRDIRESSGVAASRIRENIFWTHNDSGDVARLFAFEENGTHVGTWSVPIKSAIDWEDMAAFELDGQPVLMIADTGDNQKRRRNYQLHFVRESMPAADAKLELLQTVNFRYPSGNQDCEAVAFDPSLQQILLITKNWEPNCEIHTIDWPVAQSNAVVTTTKIADLRIAGITGLDISPSGEFAVATTYGNAYMFRREPSESWTDAFAKAGRTIIVPPRKQGESICFAHDGHSLVLTSEKLPTPIFRLTATRVEE